jgi:hypothetical protein
VSILTAVLVELFLAVLFFATYYRLPYALTHMVWHQQGRADEPPPLRPRAAPAHRFADERLTHGTETGTDLGEGDVGVDGMPFDESRGAVSTHSRSARTRLPTRVRAGCASYRKPLPRSPRPHFAYCARAEKRRLMGRGEVDGRRRRGVEGTEE